jgi:hypothetical protein
MHLIKTNLSNKPYLLELTHERQLVVREKCASSLRGSNLSWNEDLLFFVVEPFDPLPWKTSSPDIWSVRCTFRYPLCTGVLTIGPSCCRAGSTLCGDEARPYAGQVLCLDGGYHHVLDEAADEASDVHLPSKQLSKPPVCICGGGASNLMSMKIAKNGRAAR